MSRADERRDITVEQYIRSIGDASVERDTRIIYDLMYRISGEEPILYGIGTIGFGVYKFEYESGRKGESHSLAFYPRKGKITIYLTDGTKRYAEQLSKLGKHTTTGYCVYVKQLDDIDLSVLESILTASYKNLATQTQNGPINQIPWQAE